MNRYNQNNNMMPRRMYSNQQRMATPQYDGGENEIKTESRSDIDRMPIGMSYVPWQAWSTTFEAEEGMGKGTIFPELVLPFKGGM